MNKTKKNTKKNTSKTMESWVEELGFCSYCTDKDCKKEKCSIMKNKDNIMNDLFKMIFQEENRDVNDMYNKLLKYKNN